MWFILTCKHSQTRKTVNCSASQWPELNLFNSIRRQNALPGTNKKRCIARWCVRMITTQGKIQTTCIRILLKSIFNQLNLIHYSSIILTVIDRSVDQLWNSPQQHRGGYQRVLWLIDSCNVCVPRVCICVGAHDPPMHPASSLVQ